MRGRRRIADNPTVIQRNEKGHFIGTGNPGGRPKRAFSFKEKAGKYSDEMLDILIKIARDEGQETRDRIVAATRVAEWGVGKPVQSLDARVIGAVGVGAASPALLAALTDEELATVGGVADKLLLTAMTEEDSEDGE